MLRTSHSQGSRYRWELIWWLCCAFFLNQADRQVYSAILPQLKRDLVLSDVEAGLVATVFSIVLAVCVPLAGWAGDHWDRKRIIVLSLAGWSLSTLLSGFATGLLFLVAVRSLATGAGEALYAPAAYALMGQYHGETRSRAMSIHQTALYVGVVTSGFLAGWIADRYGWRYSFWLFGGLGLLLSVLIAIRLRPAPPLLLEGQEPPLARAAVLHLLRIPTARYLALAFGCMVFVNVGYLTWMPTYLHERFQRSLAESGFQSMFWHHLFAFAGVAAAGWAADRWSRWQPRRRLQIQAAGLLAGAPFLYMVGAASNLTTLLVMLAGFGFCRGVYDSNTYASLFEVVEPRFHATASGLFIAQGFLFGAFAPVALGFIKQTLGLAMGLSILGGVYLAGALCLGYASVRCFATDYSRKVQF